MLEMDVRDFFSNIMMKEPDTSAAIAGIRTLLKYLENDNSGTLQELVENIKGAISVMKDTDFSTASVMSGCDLFLQYITLAGLEKPNIGECKIVMAGRGRTFLKRAAEARGKIARLVVPFITDGSTILTHSKSRVVLQALEEAAKSNRRFEVFVTMCASDNSGKEMCTALTKQGITCTCILDAQVGYIMDQVDMVMTGAEGVVETGGHLNKIGTFTMAVCAKALNKPFYVLSESFKFVRLYPLNQRDIPDELKYTSSVRSRIKEEGGCLKQEPPLIDYTPPGYVTLLFTDLGILTPSAVSDELIQLYT